MALSALVVLAGLASRITGGEELSAAVIATPTPTPLTATFDETVETRQVTCPAETWYCLQTGSALVPALGLCVFPFIPGDLVKMIAAMLLGPVIRERIRKASAQ